MLKSFTQVILSAIAAKAQAEVVEMNDEKEPGEWFKPYEHAVVSFYNEMEDSQQVNAMIDDAYALYERQQTEGEKSLRSVGWFRVNIDKYPGLA